MIPFSDWSRAHSNEGDFPNFAQVTGSHLAEADAVQDEVTLLLDAMLDNLMTSSIAGLRTSLELVGESWATKQLSRQEQFLKREIEKIEEKITTAVADALLPVLSELQLYDVIQDFATTLQKLLPEFKTQDLLIKAPTDIHEMLSSALESKTIAAEIGSSESADITVAGNHVVLVANLSAWSQKIKEFAFK
jgi:hypothetical protein